jgi:hypothetical protein
MAFEDRDTTEPLSTTRTKKVQEIVQRVNPTDPAGPPTILVTWLEVVDGERQLVTKRVPPALVASNWPCAQRTLKAWDLLIIDNATE